MPNLQELDNDQINEAVRGAADRRIPVSLTLHQLEGWTVYYSRFVALDGQHILLALPRTDNGEIHEFGLADRVGLSFKYRHHKHICSVIVAGLAPLAGSDDPTPLLTVVSPTQMHRLQRRVYQRVAVPETQIVRASFWLGGRDAEPVGAASEVPVWSGSVENLSAGGFQMSCRDYTGPQLQMGDAVGVCLSFGLGRDNCFADAQFRHFDLREGAAHMGFQFVGLAQSRHGRAALQLLSAKVSDLQRLEGARGRRRYAS